MRFYMSLKPSFYSLPEKYKLVVYKKTYKNQYLSLMQKSGFKDFKDVNKLMQQALPDGIFLITYKNKIIATASALHKPIPRFPFGGELGWVAVHPKHRNKGLAHFLCYTVLLRFKKAGYKNIYVVTDDWRYPAIKVYSDLGFNKI